MTNAIPHRSLPVGQHHAPQAAGQKSVAADFQKWFAETYTPSATPSGTPTSVLAGLTAASTSTVTEIPNSPASVSTPFDPAVSANPSEPADASTSPESVKTGPQTPFFEKSVTGMSFQGTPSTYNTTQFATAATAQKFAKLVGGKVEDVELSGAFSRSAPERMIAVGGHELNAGLVADLFAKYGYEPGSEAWQVINRDLGKTHG
jgi:hypothetical protein